MGREVWLGIPLSLEGGRVEVSLGEGVVTLHFSLSGGEELPISLNREDLEALLDVLDELYGWVVSQEWADEFEGLEEEGEEALP